MQYFISARIIKMIRRKRARDDIEMVHSDRSKSTSSSPASVACQRESSSSRNAELIEPKKDSKMDSVDTRSNDTNLETAACPSCLPFDKMSSLEAECCSGVQGPSNLALIHIRNKILKIWFENPMQKLTPELAVQKIGASYSGDPALVIRTHTFLERNGFINNGTEQAAAPAQVPPPSNHHSSHKRKHSEHLEDADPARLTDDEREAKIVDTLQRLKAFIEECKPAMIANYNAECERVLEERKKIQIASAAEGVPATECTKRRPKRRFPWCPTSRALLGRLVKLATDQESAALLLAKRALPLFPTGYVRMPTLLRQADLSKQLKVSYIKGHRSITTTSDTSNVNNQQKPEKKVNNAVSNDKQKDGLIQVKSPAALNKMVNKQEKNKALENIHKREKDKHRKEKNHHSHSNDKTHSSKEKRVNSPLHIDTSYQPKQKEPTPSPKNKDEVSKKQIENMRIDERNIPRPVLIPVHHSPTFAKPDKRPPEKKKKDLLIVLNLDPLAEIISEPVAIDDSSRDVEVVVEKSDKSDKDRSESESVPSRDKVSEVNHRKDGKSDGAEEMDEAIKEDFDSIMKNLLSYKF